jgi:hypothetical protein
MAVPVVAKIPDGRADTERGEVPPVEGPLEAPAVADVRFAVGNRFARKKTVHEAGCPLLRVRVAVST